MGGEFSTEYSDIFWLARNIGKENLLGNILFGEKVDDCIQITVPNQI